MSDTQRQPAPKSAADLRVNLEALHQQLRNAIDAIESGEQWQAWLSCARKLHQYSFNNVILIFSQRPSASQVAGYTTWQSVGRHVRRGEKAIRVMAPIVRKASAVGRSAVTRTEADRGEPDRHVVGFRAVPVFDVSQTDGPPIPRQEEPRLLAGSAPDGLWDRLAQEIAERGYRLQRCDGGRLDGANGLTDVKERQVWVRDDVDPAQAVKTLAHELAHVMLHVQDGTVPECRGVIEVEAESVAHLVLGAHNVDTGAYSFPYVAAWAYPLAAIEHVPMSDVVARTGTRVMKAANEVLSSNHQATAILPSDALAPVAARVSTTTHQVSELREQAEAAALPSVDRQVLIGVVADSHEYFRRKVLASWVPDYLVGRLLRDALESHEIGYAPPGWTNLTDHLRSLGYADDHIEAAGMATRARTGHLVDRLRDRMTIPLRDGFGTCVAFSGRTAYSDAESGPRYLNTPTTAIFTKGAVLYGLAEHHSTARDDMPVVCEGPLDAIAVDLAAKLHKLELFGVAASGTAFTADHARLLEYATRGQPICLAFDADQAGWRATQDTWRQITDTRWRVVSVADLPDGADPAGLFTTQPDLLAEILTSPRPAGAVIAERQIDEANLVGDVNREVAAFRELVVLTRRMPPDDRVPYVLLLADRLRIDPPVAAALVAECNPNMMLTERATRGSRFLGHQLDEAIASERDNSIGTGELTNRDQLAIIHNAGRGR